MVADAFNPSTHLGGRQEDLCEFKASLVYRVSSRIGSKATQRNPVSKQKQINKKGNPENKVSLDVGPVRWFSS